MFSFPKERVMAFFLGPLRPLVLAVCKKVIQVNVPLLADLAVLLKSLKVFLAMTVTATYLIIIFSTNFIPFLLYITVKSDSFWTKMT